MIVYTCLGCGKFGESDSSVCPSCGRALALDEIKEGDKDNCVPGSMRLGFGVYLGVVLAFLTAGSAFLLTAGGHGWLSPCIVSVICLVNYPMTGIGWTTRNKNRAFWIGFYLVVCAILFDFYLVAQELHSYREGDADLHSRPWLSWQAIVWATLYFGQQVGGIALVFRRQDQKHLGEFGKH